MSFRCWPATRGHLASLGPDLAEDKLDPKLDKTFNRMAAAMGGGDNQWEGEAP